MTTHWLLIFESGALATSWAVLACIALELALCKDCGHKPLLWSSVGFFGFWAFYCLVRGIKFYVNQPIVSVQVFTAGAVLAVIFCLYVLACKEDLHTTLRSSEAEDRIRQDRIADQAQVRQNLEYLMVTNQLRTEALAKEMTERRTA